MSFEATQGVIYGATVEGSKHVSSLLVFRVLLVLADHANAQGGACPSQASIARELGVERRDVRNAVTALVAQGRILKVGEAIPRVRGTVYALPNSGGQRPPESDPTRAGNARHSSEWGEGDNSGGQRPPETGQLGRELGRALPATNPLTDLSTSRDGSGTRRRARAGDRRVHPWPCDCDECHEAVEALVDMPHAEPGPGLAEDEALW